MIDIPEAAATSPGTLIVAALVGAFASIAVRAVNSWLENSARAVGLLRGVLIEIDRAEECASTYIKEQSDRLAWAPAYRIQLDFLHSGVRTLMELRALSPDQVVAIHRLYIFASEVNWCLESLARMRERPDSRSDSTSRLMKEETNRTTGKCQHVLEEVPKARAAAEAALRRIAWREQQD